VDEGQSQKQPQHQNNQSRQTYIFLMAAVGRCF
jgi:hypothetical protein